MEIILSKEWGEECLSQLEAAGLRVINMDREVKSRTASVDVVVEGEGGKLILIEEKSLLLHLIRKVIGPNGVKRGGRIDIEAVKTKLSHLSLQQRRWLIEAGIGELFSSIGYKVIGTLTELCRRRQINGVEFYCAYSTPSQLRQMERLFLGVTRFKLKKLEIIPCRKLVEKLQKEVKK